jgi:nucleoside-diphosphate-sugar epimerase
VRVLVTGGAGFIGSHLVDLLVTKGHDVTVIALPGESLDNLTGVPAQVIQCDLLDRSRLLSSTKSVDIIYHLAARTDLDGRSLHDYQVNLLGTDNVCDLARRCGVARMVFYSSMLSVALTGSPEPIDESLEAENPTMYGRSKREGERIVARSGVPWTVIRPTLVYGPRERSTMWQFFRALRRRQFMLIGGDVLQSFLYVKNLVQATYQASGDQAAEGKVYFINDSRAYTLAEFAASASEACGTRLRDTRLPYAAAMCAAYLMLGAKTLFKVAIPLTPNRVRTMCTHYVYSIARAQRDFAYQPPYDLQRGVQETADWYMQRGML